MKFLTVTCLHLSFCICSFPWYKINRLHTQSKFSASQLTCCLLSYPCTPLRSLGLFSPCPSTRYLQTAESFPFTFSFEVEQSQLIQHLLVCHVLQPIQLGGSAPGSGSAVMCCSCCGACSCWVGRNKWFHDLLTVFLLLLPGCGWPSLLKNILLLSDNGCLRALYVSDRRWLILKRSELASTLR